MSHTLTIDESRHGGRTPDHGNAAECPAQQVSGEGSRR